jgi:hypothetical protein
MGRHCIKNNLKGSLTWDFQLQAFFMKPSAPPPRSITLGPFRMFCRCYSTCDKLFAGVMESMKILYKEVITCFVDTGDSLQRCEYLREVSYKFEMAPMWYSGARGKHFMTKTWRYKSSCQNPFNILHYTRHSDLQYASLTTIPFLYRYHAFPNPFLHSFLLG